MPLIVKESPALQEFSKTFRQKFMSIRIGEPNRERCIWFVGLTDNEDQFKNSFKCNSTGDAEALLEYILSQNFSNIVRGEDHGFAAFRDIVYLFGKDR